MCTCQCGPVFDVTILQLAEIYFNVVNKAIILSRDDNEWVYMLQYRFPVNTLIWWLPFSSDYRNDQKIHTASSQKFYCTQQPFATLWPTVCRHLTTKHEYVKQIVNVTKGLPFTSLQRSVIEKFQHQDNGSKCVQASHCYVTADIICYRDKSCQSRSCYSNGSENCLKIKGVSQSWWMTTAHSLSVLPLCGCSSTHSTVKCLVNTTIENV
jgi:hypothetical protein